MKRLLCLILTLIMLFSLCACEGNWEKLNLKDPINIPADGSINQSTIQQIKNENAIAIFNGSSGDYTYKWTIFAKTIQTVKSVNLGITLAETADGNIRVSLTQKEAFGFSGFLAIQLNKHWDAESATAYSGETAFTTVSLTGSKNTILNITLDGTVGEFVIRPDPLLNPQTPTEETEPTIPTDTSDTSGAQPEVPAEPTEPTEQPTQPTKDQYLTDPVPDGKPNPVEPENQEIDKNTVYTCTFSIECSTILNNLDMLDPDKLEMVPYDGVILATVTVTFYEGESVCDVLQRVCKEYGIHMEASWTPIYNSAYIEGIHNLYEFDCGALSGWMYRVNGWYPNYGCSRYQLEDGDVVEWRYTCDLGNDVGGGYAIGG